MTTLGDPKHSVPRPARGVDVTKLPLSGMEGFVLSRVDGTFPISDLASVTGLSLEETSSILEKLADLGAIEIPGYAKKPASAPPPPVQQPEAPAAEMASSAPPVARDGLEACDVDPELQHRIVETFAELDRIDHYQLLGVARSADRKAIKSAYYAMASTFHTDRYFGRNIGSFKTKMEQIFSRATIAHDTLASASRREEYDRYLAGQEQTLAYEQLLEEVDETALQPIEERPTPDRVVVRRSDAPNAEETPRSSAPPPKTPTTPVPLTPEQERARREALARKLGGSSRRMHAVRPTSNAPGARLLTPTPPPVEALGPTRTASAVVRRPLDGAAEEARRLAAKKHGEEGAVASAKGDHLAAAKAYRAAHKLTSDPLFEAAHRDAAAKVKAALVDTYLQQARYEEQSQNWTMAALSYLKALDGRPEDPELAERAANALRSEGRDLHRAAHLAEQAVQAKPNHGAYRATLGHVYLDAKLFLRARSELEHAARLLPNDARVRELLSRARKAAS